MRTKYLKIIIMRHICQHRPLVRNACQDEMYCFRAYIDQLKSQYETYSTDRLESLASGVLLSGLETS